MKRAMPFGILPKLLITMMAVTLLPLGAIWYLDYRSSSARLSRDIDERLGAQADAGASYVDAWIEMNVKMLRQNASLDEMISMKAPRQAPILVSMSAEYPWAYLAHTMGPDGMNVARSDREAPKNYADRIYVQQALKGEPIGRQVIISRTTGQPALALSVPITTGDRIVGVLSIAMSVDDITRKITNVRIGETGYAFLVDETGNVIAHPRARDNLVKHAALTALTGDVKRAKVTFTEAGKPIIAYARKTQLGWTLVTQQNQAEAYAPLHEANRNALILLVGSVVLVGFLSIMLARRFTSPIRHLTEIADQISRGNLAAKIYEVDRADEIGGLARAIDRLKSTVDAAMRRLTPDQRVTMRDATPVTGGKTPRS